MDRYIPLLIEAFSNLSFYVLGAGASADVVPMTSQLKNKIIQEHLTLGAYTYTPIPQNELTNRIVSSIPEDDFFLSRISPHFVIANSLYQLSQHSWNTQIAEYYSQYEVFYYAKSPSTIFTANLDNLAERCNQMHHVYHFHGVIPKHFGSSEYLKYIKEYFSLYDSMNFKPQEFLFIDKEDSNILNNNSYRLVSVQYKKSKYVVLIGYSFGKNESGIDDFYTYKYLFETLYKYNNTPILIILPDSYELKNQIQETVKSKKVYGLDMYWDCLSKALIEYFSAGNLYKGCDSKFIIQRYYYWEERKCH